MLSEASLESFYGRRKRKGDLTYWPFGVPPQRLKGPRLGEATLVKNFMVGLLEITSTKLKRCVCTHHGSISVKPPNNYLNFVRPAAKIKYLIFGILIL